MSRNNSYIPGVRPRVGNGLPGRPQRHVSQAVTQFIGSLVIVESNPGDNYVNLDGGRWDSRLESLGIAADWNPITPDDFITQPPTFTSYCAIASDSGHLVTQEETSPYLSIYRRDAGGFIRTGWPTDPPPGMSQGPLAITGDGLYVAMPLTAAPYVVIYRRDGDAINSLKKLASPFTALPPTSACYSCAFSRDGKYLAVSQPEASRVWIYSRDGDSFTRIGTVAAANSSSAARGLAMSADGRYLALSLSSSEPIRVFRRSDSNTFTALTLSAAATSTANFNLIMSDDGQYVAVPVSGSSPALQIYRRDGDVLTRLAALTMTSGLNGCAFSEDGALLMVSQNSTPWTVVYKRSGNTYLSFNAPVSSINTTGYVALAGSGAFAVVSRGVNASPRLTAFTCRKPNVQVGVGKSAYLKVEQ